MEKFFEVLIPIIIVIASIIYQLKKGANEDRPVIRKKKPRPNQPKPATSNSSGGGLRDLLREIEEAMSPQEVVIEKPKPKKPAQQNMKPIPKPQEPQEVQSTTQAPVQQQTVLTPLSNLGIHHPTHPLAKIHDMLKDNPKGMIIMHEILSKPKGLE